MSEPTLRERFDEKWQAIPETSCWWWAAYVCKGGYGRIRLDGAAKLAHRVSYELYVTAIPDGMSVLHTCDNPSCVNPEHLFLGTQQDNMRDMVEKGRGVVQKGLSHWNGKLSMHDVNEIKKLRAKGLLLREIAAKFDCSMAHVSKIALGGRR